jgi:hypothetical protein
MKPHEFRRVLLFILLMFAIPVNTISKTSRKPQTADSVVPMPVFTDLSAKTGLDFTHFNGMTGMTYLPEIMGSGSALFDYDNDGDLDVFLVQGKLLEPNKKLSDATFPWTGKKPPAGKLFRNDLKMAKDGSKSVRFVDVTDKSGIVANGYGFGVTTGDINNDGLVDLYICNLDSNKLYLNKGDGTFEDITVKSNTDDARWSISAAFLDYDLDGYLDLIVVNYGRFRVPEKQPFCFSRTSARDYCGPGAYRSEKNSLFRNRGDGSFENVTLTSGIGSDVGHSLGVITADFNDDGWIDIYVANDGDPNEVWINQKNGKFVNDGYFSGAAVSKEGKPEASMGVDAGDVNGDGNLDIFITHLMEETHTLYQNEGNAIFEDVTTRNGLGLPDQRLTGFGTQLFDFDNDGALDIFVANGSVKLLKEIIRPGNSGVLDPKYPLGQKNQLFRNLGNGRFSNVSKEAGAAFARNSVSRGASFGDIDNDGDTDIVVSNNSGKTELLINNVGQENSWLGFKVRDASGRDALGAKLRILLTSGKTLIRRSRTDGSYASSHDPRVLVGLGKKDSVKSVSVEWPDGGSQTFVPSEMKTYLTITKRKNSKK